jgi:hypothetical protein
MVPIAAANPVSAYRDEVADYCGWLKDVEGWNRLQMLESQSHANVLSLDFASYGSD